jgi:hypothetical protein
MTISVNVYDESSPGQRVGPLALDFLTEHVTARELIRDYVYQEVTEHNARQPRQPRAWRVEPTAAERALNGARPTPGGRLDWQAQYERALRAFERNGFLLLVDNRQILNLDEEIELRAGAEVVFLKLMPLVGG